MSNSRYARQSVVRWKKRSNVRRRVLIIDDEADIREVASLSLETMAGWEVIQAASAVEGVRKAAEQQPDAILLDLMMPDVDGRTTLIRLQHDQQTSKIPVLLLTAKVQSYDLETLRDLGLAGVLPKPFEPTTLSDQISAALRWQE